MIALRWLLAAFVAAALPANAEAERLVVAVSTGDVEITSNFTGAAVTVFGAVAQDEGAVAPLGPYEVAVVVRGPNETVVTWKKERFLGVFVNRRSATFAGIPAFYAASASGSLDDLAPADLLDALGIGLAHVPLGAEAAPPADFRAALVRLKSEAALYSETPDGVAFHGATIFESNIRLPANVPVGAYAASVFLFRDGALVARADQGFSIAKTGFEETISSFARDNALVYGLVCVALALATGWLAGVVFRRD